ncbi:ABC transporter ATP-binding protein [candidate division KSB1 bacterium]|nr:ABC transporter ATP-binding protein [candidate division KSB1 bacterium]
MSMLLQVENLTSTFFLDEGVLKAVDGISFQVNEKETVALVGESGCGKTIVALSLLNLIPWPGRVVGGSILFNGENLLRVNMERLRQIRGSDIGMIFQEPGAALNPVFTIGHQITEVLRLHRGLGKHEAKTEAVRLLGETGIPEPEKRIKAYPFEFSGGMQQRAVIAIAISGRPKLLIADEPTTALDVTVQGEIVDLLCYLQEQYKMAILLITHDMGVVAEMAKRVMVMYTGKLVEVAQTHALFREPKHPYTQGLLQSIPKLGFGRKEPLHGIPGVVPDFLDLPSGCTFHPRCTIGDTSCTSEFPPLRNISDMRKCACYKVGTG